MIVAVVLAPSSSGAGPADAPLPPDVECREFPLRQPLPEEGGGLFAHDVNGDGRLDLVVTSRGHIAAYAQSGRLLWMRQMEILLWPYLHHPSAIAGHLDGARSEEVACLTGPREIAVLDARTGELKRTLATPRDTVAMAVANLRGAGDGDILLQFSQTHIAAIRGDTGALLWETQEYRGIEHSPLRQADLDGDGRDEVAGATIIDHRGRKMHGWDLGDVYRSMDSLVIADIVPGLPLEVVLAEQRGAQSHTDVVNPDRIVFRSLNPWNWEDPDKVAAGDFDPARPGLEIFNRSSGGDGTARRGRDEPYANEEAPWVIDATGEVLAKYYVNDTKPNWWTGHGIEEVCRIDWDGDAADELVAKERHRNGAGAIVAPLTGEFRCILPGQALRIYAADLAGDSREEVVMLDESGSVRIFRNTAPNAGRARPSPWNAQHYRRQKQNWNYYSP
jgi:hypothetical protein